MSLETIVGGVIVFILGSFFWALFGKDVQRLANWIRRQMGIRPKIKTRKYKDLRLLEEIKSPLRFINQLPRYPSNTFREDIRAKLNEIRENVDKIKTKEFQDIKQKVIDYSDKVNQINTNIQLNKTIKLLVKDENGVYLAQSLIDEIDEIIEQNN